MGFNSGFKGLIASQIILLILDCEILGLHRSVVEIIFLLGCCTARIGWFVTDVSVQPVGPIFKGQMSTMISRQWRMEPIRFPAPAGTNHRKMAKDPEVQIS
jgi:hypothetical protein